MLELNGRKVHGNLVTMAFREVKQAEAYSSDNFIFIIYGEMSGERSAL